MAEFCHLPIIHLERAGIFLFWRLGRLPEIVARSSVRFQNNVSFLPRLKKRTRSHFLMGANHFAWSHNNHRSSRKRRRPFHNIYIQISSPTILGSAPKPVHQHMSIRSDGPKFHIATPLLLSAWESVSRDGIPTIYLRSRLRRKKVRMFFKGRLLCAALLVTGINVFIIFSCSVEQKVRTVENHPYLWTNDEYLLLPVFFITLPIKCNIDSGLYMFKDFSIT